MPGSVSILDCTLRDGACAIDYQFGANDTFVIARALERAGFDLIEVGHGLGLGASRNPSMAAAVSDEDYLRAAVAATYRARIGMFFMPGIGTVEDLERAADLGLGFVRIGVNVNDVGLAAPFCSLARRLGLETSINLMKSYAVTVADFGDIAAAAEQFGADTVCVVDSAGGMLPEEVRAYVEVARSRMTSARIGFHGHNNLQLAIANTLAAIDAGAGVVDSCLKGMGRNAGNAQTEVLVMVLDRLGYRHGIDAMQTLDLGEGVVQSVLRQDQGVDALSVTSGIGQFHTSFLGLVEDVAHAVGVNVRKLILAVSERERIHPTRELVESVARELAGTAPRAEMAPLVEPFAEDCGDGDIPEVPDASDCTLEEALAAVRRLAARTGKPTLFTLSRTRREDLAEPRFRFVRETDGFIVGNAEYPEVEFAEEILSAIDGRVDHIAIDASAGADELDYLLGYVERSEPMTYSDIDAAIHAAAKLILELAERRGAERIALVGLSPRWAGLVWSLAERELDISVVDASARGLPAQERTTDELENVDLVVGCSPERPSVRAEMVRRLRGNGAVVDVGVGALSPDAIDAARERGLPVYRLDMRAGLTGELETALGTHELINDIVGAGELAGVAAVADELSGREGDVVVDHIGSPICTIGVADGDGGLYADANEALKRIERALLARRFAGDEKHDSN